MHIFCHIGAWVFIGIASWSTNLSPHDRLEAFALAMLSCLMGHARETLGYAREWKWEHDRQEARKQGYREAIYKNIEECPLRNPILRAEWVNGWSERKAEK